MTQLLLDRQGRSSSVEAKLQSTMRLYEFLLTNHLLLASTPGLRSKTVQSICDMESMARELYMAEEGVEDFLELARAFREFVRGPLMEHPRWFE